MVIGFKPAFVPKIEIGSKIHTVRDNERFSNGTIMHMATGVRTKQYKCFKETICTGREKIVIIPQGWIKEQVISKIPKIIIEGRQLANYEVLNFIENDGFDTVESFVDWFDKPFNGFLIHWTQYRYINNHEL